MNNEKECNCKEEEKYNGWSNRETWAYSLWIGDDSEHYHELVNNLLLTLKDEDKEFNQNKNWIRAKIADMLSDNLSDIEEEFHEDSKTFNCYSRMLKDIGSLWRINYNEVASSNFEDEINNYLKSFKTGV